MRTISRAFNRVATEFFAVLLRAMIKGFFFLLLVAISLVIIIKFLK